MKPDVIVEGPEAAAALLALCMQRLRPDWTIWLCLRPGPVPTDEPQPLSLLGLPPELAEIVEPLIVRRWGDYHVLSDTFHRRVDGDVALISPDQLAADLLQVLPPSRVLRSGPVGSAPLQAGLPHAATRVLVGSRPEDRGESAVSIGTQTFRFEEHHGLNTPIALDVTKKWHGVDFIQYYPQSSRTLQIRYLSFGGVPEVPAQLVHDESWPAGRMLGERRFQIPWSEPPASASEQGEVVVAGWGACLMDPVFLAPEWWVLHAALALTRPVRPLARDMAAAVNAACNAFAQLGGWPGFNQALIDAPSDAKQRLLAGLYEP